MSRAKAIVVFAFTLLTAALLVAGGAQAVEAVNVRVAAPAIDLTNAVTRQIAWLTGIERHRRVVATIHLLQIQADHFGLVRESQGSRRNVMATMTVHREA